MIACAGLLGACGDDSPQRAAGTPAPAATATATPPPAATATPDSTPPPAPPEQGDEEGNRVPLTLRLAPEDVLPAEAEVQAFLGLRLEVRNESGAERVVRLDGEPVLELLPGQAQTVDLKGLAPGEHTVEAGESGRAVVTAVRAG